MLTSNVGSNIAKSQQNLNKVNLHKINNLKDLSDSNYNENSSSNINDGLSEIHQAQTTLKSDRYNIELDKSLDGMKNTDNSNDNANFKNNN